MLTPACFGLWLSTAPCAPPPGRGEAKVGRVEVLRIHPSAATALIMQQSPNQAWDVITQMELQRRASERECVSVSISVHHVCLSVCSVAGNSCVYTALCIWRLYASRYKTVFDLLLCSTSSASVKPGNVSTACRRSGVYLYTDVFQV